MFCPQCGAPNEQESIFCGNCGAVMDPEALPAEATTEDAEEFVEEAIEEAASDLKVKEPQPEPPPFDDLPDEPSPPPPSPPPSPPSYPASPPTSGLAIAALLLGIGGLTVLPLFGSVLALVFGYMARNDIRQRPGEVSGDGLAVAGIVMGWIAVGLTILGILGVGGFMICGFCGAIGAGSY